jgi:hypothetical protein
MFPAIPRSHAEADYVALADRLRDHRLVREDASVGAKGARSILDRLVALSCIDLGEGADRDDFKRSRHCLAPDDRKDTGRISAVFTRLPASPGRAS